MAKAIVLIPTHNHPALLPFAVRSAVQQTEPDIEILIVGDGVTVETRKVITQLQQEDSRIRFFDCPKGPRHGELSRHQALLRSHADIVCYLSDDDLLLPDHVQSMLELLRTSDFTHALPVEILPDGSVSCFSVDLSLPADQAVLLGGENRIPLTGAAHRFGTYLKLPFGWRTTPADTPTDLYMWQQWLKFPGVRVCSGMQPTALVFPSSRRTHLTLEQRVFELRTWQQIGSSTQQRIDFQTKLIQFLAQERAIWSSRCRVQSATVSSLKALF